jgi:hypothetical protein
MLREKSIKHAQEELIALTKFAKTQGYIAADQESLRLWDVPFVSERLRESQYQFEEVVCMCVCVCVCVCVVFFIVMCSNFFSFILKLI